MADFGITAEQFERDREIIAKSLRLMDLHGQPGAAREASVEAGTAYRSMERRHQAEERERFLARHNADHHAALCGEASYELTKLTRERPQLFESTPGSPPRLRGLLDDQAKTDATP